MRVFVNNIQGDGMQDCAPGMGVCSIRTLSVNSPPIPHQAPGGVGHTTDGCITDLAISLAFNALVINSTSSPHR